MKDIIHGLTGCFLLIFGFFFAIYLCFLAPWLMGAILFCVIGMIFSS